MCSLFWLHFCNSFCFEEIENEIRNLRVGLEENSVAQSVSAVGYTLHFTHSAVPEATTLCKICFRRCAWAVFLIPLNWLWRLCRETVTTNAAKRCCFGYFRALRLLNFVTLMMSLSTSFPSKPFNCFQLDLALVPRLHFTLTTCCNISGFSLTWIEFLY